MQDVKLEYQKREQRVRDAVALKEPDRVPIIPVMEAFPVYYGGKTIKQVMDDYRETKAALTSSMKISSRILVGIPLCSSLPPRSRQWVSTGSVGPVTVSMTPTSCTSISKMST